MNFQIFLKEWPNHTREKHHAVVNLQAVYILRAPVCKNQTNSKFRAKCGKFDFFHILMLDKLGYN